jgi:hypothetical protein
MASPFTNFIAASALGLNHVDRARTHVTIDTHLLAGHGVQREAGADFGDALGALGDDYELHNGNDQEHDQANDQVAADDELAERLDDVTGVGL